jgi:phosphoribosylglycinamide formyltransferase-1
MLTSTRPLRVAVLCSRRAPGLARLLDEGPRRDHPFEIVGVVTSDPACVDGDALRERGVDLVIHAIHAFYGARHSNVYRDLVTRRHYDAETVRLLQAWSPDIVLLDGYLFLLTRPMLEAFPNRIVNLHFSDLTVRRVDRSPAYPGIRAVRDALADGQIETSATVHAVDERPDGGAPIVRSWPFPVSPLVAEARRWGAIDMVKAYAFAHQEWMLRSVSAPLVSAALRLLAAGEVDLDALAAREPSAVTPWLLDERGRLTPPAGARMHAILQGYHRASVA